MKRPILFLLPNLEPGGAEKVFLTLADHLGREGAEVHLALMHSSGALLAEVPEHITVHRLFPYSRKFLGYELYCAYALAKLADRLKVKACLSTLPPANVVNIWAQQLSNHSHRVIIREANTPSVYVRQGLRPRLLDGIAQLFYRKADIFVAPSNEVASDAQAHYQIPREKIKIIPNPIDFEEIRRKADGPLEIDDFKSDELIVMAMGRLTYQKGFDVLIQAFSQVKMKAKLYIFGAGELEQELRRLIKSLHQSERIILAGHVANPFPYLKRCDLFVLSSRFEGQPNVLLQAMALGRPIVSTDCPSGPRELLESSSLAEVDDADSLRDKISTQLMKPKNDESAMSKLERLTAQNISGRWKQLMSMEKL